MAGPWTRTPPVEWWKLWPGGADTRKSPEDGYPADGRHFLAVSICNDLVIPTGETVIRTVTLTEFGWSFRCQFFAFTPDENLRITIIDVGSGRKLVTGASAFAFVGGMGGKSFIPYSYQFDQRASISVEMTYAGVGRSSINAAILGQSIRGVV